MEAKTVISWMNFSYFKVYKDSVIICPWNAHKLTKKIISILIRLEWENIVLYVKLYAYSLCNGSSLILLTALPSLPQQPYNVDTLLISDYMDGNWIKINS